MGIVRCARLVEEMACYRLETTEAMRLLERMFVGKFVRAIWVRMEAREFAEIVEKSIMGSVVVGFVVAWKGKIVGVIDVNVGGSVSADVSGIEDVRIVAVFEEREHGTGFVGELRSWKG